MILRVIVLLTIVDMTVGRGIRACAIYQIKSFHLLHDIFLVIISIETNLTARVAAAYF